MHTPTLIPLAEAALRLGATREVVLRRLMRRELRGERRNGRWLIDEASMPAEQLTAP